MKSSGLLTVDATPGIAAHLTDGCGIEGDGVGEKCVDRGMASGRTDNSLLFQKSLGVFLKWVLCSCVLKCIFGWVNLAGTDDGALVGVVVFGP